MPAYSSLRALAAACVLSVPIMAADAATANGKTVTLNTVGTRVRT